MRHKSEVPKKVIAFVNFVHAQTTHRIKAIRSDNGTEYINRELTNFLERQGIQHQLTVPYTPEHNGASERDNRTIVEAARTMIHSCDMNLSLWAEAMNSAVYVLNRTGTSTVANKTPFELWHQKSASVDKLLVFGSIVYTHIPKIKRRKLDKKANKCIFVGYSENSKGFRVYNQEKHSIEIARDVIFEK